jgi:hypothetical protein
VTSDQKSMDAAIAEAASLRDILREQRSKQVTSEDEKQIIKATAHAWFNNHRTVIVTVIGEDQLKPVDDLYRNLLTFAARRTLRNKYLQAIKGVRTKLGDMLADHAIGLAKNLVSSAIPAASTDNASQFSPLISDPKMQAILQKRWQECVICVRIRGAPRRDRHDGRYSRGTASREDRPAPEYGTGFHCYTCT